MPRLLQNAIELSVLRVRGGSAMYTNHMPRAYRRPIAVVTSILVALLCVSQVALSGVAKGDVEEIKQVFLTEAVQVITKILLSTPLCATVENSRPKPATCVFWKRSPRRLSSVRSRS